MLEFNQMIGSLIANEFKMFKRIEEIEESKSEEIYDVRVMRFYC
jgi:hypothetical protein